MSWTKGEIINDIFAMLAIHGYVSDIEPEEERLAGRIVDTMMAEWDARGIRIGYALSSSPGSLNLEQDSGVPLYAVSAVISNGAVRLAAAKGKVVTQELKAQAKTGYDQLLIDAARPQQQQLPNTLQRGQGSKPWRTRNRPYLPTPDDSPLRDSQGGDLTILTE